MLVGVLTVPRALMRYVPAFERYDVPILVVPLTVVFVVLCALTFRDARRVRFIVWGSLVLLACSFALHAVGPQADADGSRTYLATHTWAYQVTGMLKHGAELAGWMLLATGMAAAASPPMEDDLLAVSISALDRQEQSLWFLRRSHPRRLDRACCLAAADPSCGHCATRSGERASLIPQRLRCCPRSW